MKINKKIDLDLTSLDSNAFSLMGGLRRQARREGWTPKEILMNIFAQLAHDVIFKDMPLKDKAKTLANLGEQMYQATCNNYKVLNLLVPLDLEAIVAFKKDQQELDKARVEIAQWFKENVAE